MIPRVEYMGMAWSDGFLGIRQIFVVDSGSFATELGMFVRVTNSFHPVMSGLQMR